MSKYILIFYLFSILDIKETLLVRKRIMEYGRSMQRGVQKGLDRNPKSKGDQSANLRGGGTWNRPGGVGLLSHC